MSNKKSKSNIKKAIDDLSICIEHEAIANKNPEAISSLTSAFREVLQERTQQAFTQDDKSNK